MRPAKKKINPTYSHKKQEIYWTLIFIDENMPIKFSKKLTTSSIIK